MGQQDLLLMMGFMSGQNFNNLKMQDREALQHGHWRADGWLRQIGHICAVDYLIGNQDRFPVVGLDIINRGNMMLCDNKVVAIDNTMVTHLTLLNDNFPARHATRLRVLMRLLDNPLDAQAHDLLRPVEQFFTLIMDTPVSWDRIAAPFIQGFCNGLSAIAAIRPARLMALVEEAEKAKSINPALVAFLCGNLQQIPEGVRRRRPPGPAHGGDWAGDGRQRARA